MFYSHAMQTQLRIRCDLAVLTGSSVAEEWKQLAHTAQARDYMTAQAPSSELHEGDNDAAQTSEHHFAIINAKVISLDTLELRAPPLGHRRALFRDVGREAKWLVP